MSGLPGTPVPMPGELVEGRIADAIPPDPDVEREFQEAMAAVDRAERAAWEASWDVWLR